MGKISFYRLVNLCTLVEFDGQQRSFQNNAITTQMHLQITQNIEGSMSINTNKGHTISPVTVQRKMPKNPHIFYTLSFELALSMMYLMEPWIFSVQLTSHVTVLSCRTSFQWWPAGGMGIKASLSVRHVNDKPKQVSVDLGRLNAW